MRNAGCGWPSSTNNVALAAHVLGPCSDPNPAHRHPRDHRPAMSGAGASGVGGIRGRIVADVRLRSPARREADEKGAS